MSKPLYKLCNVRQVYNGRTVLRVDELTLYPQETFALVGPSGAGKSTLLRLLGLLEPPSQGELTLHLDGNRYTHGSLPLETRRRLGMVFQQPALLSRSVRQNVAYGLRLRGNRHTAERVSEMLASVQLTHVADAPAKTLSGGERQRVAIARALVLKPAVLILDEPTANLDPYNISVIEDLLREHCQNTTIIVVTHNIFQAKRLAGRVSLLLEGQLIETAPAQTFFDAPADSRTAAFLRGDIIY